MTRDRPAVTLRAGKRLGVLVSGDTSPRLKKSRVGLRVKFTPLGQFRSFANRCLLFHVTPLFALVGLQTGVMREGRPVEKSVLEPSEEAERVRRCLKERIDRTPRAALCARLGIDWPQNSPQSGTSVTS